MSRIADGCRPYGRDNEDKLRGGAAGLIKIGFDGREFIAEAKRKDAHKIPKKLPGFLLCYNRLDRSTGNSEIDYASMANLDPRFDKAAIALAKKDCERAPSGTLPTELEFLIMDNAGRGADERWNFAGLFSEAFACWDKGITPFCTGDGNEADRRQDDGTTKEIVCNPVGKPGVAAADICPWSAKKLCRLQSSLSVCLIKSGADGTIKPLNRALGLSARYEFRSASGWNPARIVAELDRAADYVEGRLRGIRGVLIFAMQMKRTGDGGTYPTHQVLFQLNALDLENRRMEMLRERRLRVDEGRVAAGLLEPPKDVEDDPIDARFGPVVAADTEEAEPEQEPETDVNGFQVERAAHSEPPSNDTPPFMQDERNAEPDYGRDDFSDAAPEPEPANVIIGMVEAISEKTGTKKNGEPWTKWGIKIGGEWIGTFSASIRNAAQSAKHSGKPVQIEFEMNDKFKSIKTIEPVAAVRQ